MIIAWPKHIRQNQPCADTCAGACPACALFTCAVCGATEGELPADCPGYRMHPDERAAIYNGHVDYRWQPRMGRVIAVPAGRQP